MVYKKGHYVSEEVRKRVSECMKALMTESYRKDFSEKIKNIMKNPIIRKKISLALKGKKLSEKTKQKLRENAEINPNYGMKGKHFSEETKRRMSLVASRGRHHSEEAKLKIGLAHKGKHLWNNKIHPLLGKKHSEETKHKMSLIVRQLYKENKRQVWNKGLSKEKHPMYGKEHRISTIVKMKEKRKFLITPIKDTTIEVKIQNYLKQSGITFFTHQYINIKHGYQCDILLPSLNLVIECDGNYWHKYPIGNEIDHIRTSELIEKGFKVLRLWEVEIRNLTLDDFRNKLNGVTNNAINNATN